MVDIEYEIKNLESTEVKQLKAITDTEEWYYTEEFLEGCRNYCPEAFFVAVTNQGEVIGHCGAILFGESSAKLGFFIIKSALRGKGIGKRLLNKTLSFLEDRNIGLDAMPGVDVLYRKIGFNVESFETQFITLAPKIDADIKKADGVIIMNSSDVDFEKVKDYDMTLSSMSRDRVTFLRHLFNFSTKSSVAVKNDEVVGYGCCQYDVTGLYVSPLYANDPEIARMLWDTLIVNRNDAGDVAINLFIPNRDAASMFQSCATVVSGPHTMKRMYTNETIQWNEERVFAFGNGEL